MSGIALAPQPSTLDQQPADGRPFSGDEQGWRLRALCRSIDADRLFVTGARQRQATSICRNCPVKRECAVEALDNKMEYGIWGGLTERQRRALLRQYPHVESWAAFLATHHAAAGTG